MGRGWWRLSIGAALILLAGCGGSFNLFNFGRSSLMSSSRPGMGAVPYSNGVTFRVWAPGAQRVWVAGDFDGWMPTEMGNEFNGNFSLDYDGAQPGQQYKFQIQNNGNTFWRTDPRAQQVVNSIGNGIIHNRTSYPWQHDLDFHMPLWHDQVFYEMHIGAFNSPGGGSGSFQSAVTKLDYLQWLGVNMIELMPVSEFPGNYSWGYNPTNPFAPAMQYGSPDDLKYFVDQAHARGIGVVLDMTYNHFGPSDDLKYSLWQFDGESWNGGGGIYFYNDWRAYTPWGNTRPDFGRQQVRDYIRDNVLQWLDEYHMDGMRLDSTPEMYQTDSGGGLPDGWSMLQEISDTVHNDSPWKIMIGEDMHENGAISQPTSQGGAGLDAQWEPDFVHPIQWVLTQVNDSDRDMNTVAYALYHNYNSDGLQRILYTESHDETANGKQRVPQMIDPSNPGSYFAKKRSTLGAALVMTAPGRPMILQGQEFMTGGWFQAEVPLNWNNCNYFHGILQMYQDLIHLRRDWNGNTAGLRGKNINVFHVDNYNKVIAYHRWDNGGPNDDTIVVANFSNQTFYNYNLGLPRGGLWSLRFNSDWNGYSPDFANTNTYDVGANGGGMDGMPYTGTINAIGPYAVLVYSQNN